MNDFSVYFKELKNSEDEILEEFRLRLSAIATIAVAELHCLDVEVAKNLQKTHDRAQKLCLNARLRDKEFKKKYAPDTRFIRYFGF